MEITKIEAPTDGLFALIKQPYAKQQHPNQQGGLDLYVDIIDLDTGNLNSVKLYENKKGLHFKKGGSHYLSEFIGIVTVIPYQYSIKK